MEIYMCALVPSYNLWIHLSIEVTLRHQVASDLLCRKINKYAIQDMRWLTYITDIVNPVPPFMGIRQVINKEIDTRVRSECRWYIGVDSFGKSGINAIDLHLGDQRLVGLK